MKKIRKSTAFAVMLAFLLSALMPISAFAASPAGDGQIGETISVQQSRDGEDAADEPGSDDPSGDEPGGDEPSGNESNNPNLEISGNQGILKNSIKSNNGAVSMTMLVNLPAHSITLDAIEGPDAPADMTDPENIVPYPGRWTYSWSGVGPSGQTVDRAPASGLRWSGINTELLNEVGKWTFTCTAVWEPAGGDQPSVENHTAVFVVETKGVGLELGDETPNQSMFPINLEGIETGAGQNVIYMDDPLSVKLKEPAPGSPMVYPEAAIDFGQREVEPKTFTWTCDRESLKNWVVSQRNQPKEVQYEEDLNEGTSQVHLQLDGANMTAGIAHYTCEAAGIGVNSKETHSFELQVKPFLLAVSDGTTSETPVFIDGDPQRIQLKYMYAPSSTKPLKVEWRKGIGVEDAVYKWVQVNGGAESVVQDSSGTAPVPNPMVYNLPITITERPETYSCRVTSKYLSEVVSTQETEHIVSVFSDIQPPTVILQRVTQGAPTPIVGDRLDMMGGTDVTLRAVVQQSGTASDTDILIYEWGVVKADGKTQTFTNDPPSEMTIPNVTHSANDGDVYTVTVFNRTTGYKASASVTLVVNEQPQPPEVKSASEPDHNGGLITQTEKKPVVMKAQVVNSVNAKALKFEWQQKGPNDTAWVAAKGGTAKLDTTGLISEYTIASPTITNNNDMMYRCAVYTTADKIDSPRVYTSPEFQLLILPQTGMVEFTSPEADVEETFESGQGRTMSVKARTDQGQTPVYQWYLATGRTSSDVASDQIGSMIEGATKDSYQTGRLAAGFYKFTCRASNKSDAEKYADRTFSYTVTQADNQPIVTVKGDLKVGAMVGDTVTFEVEAHTISGDPVSFKWQRRNGDKGNWADVTGGARRMLTVRDLKTSDDNAQFRCVVTNVNVPSQYFESDIIVLNVWRPEDIPVILEQPKDIRMLTGSQGAAESTLEVLVETSGKDAYIFEWYYRPDENSEWAVTELEWDELVEGDKQARAVLHVPDKESSIGEYYCTITNPGSKPAGATVKSDIVRVDILVRHKPLITSQPAPKIYANVGKTASLRVVADIAPDEPLIYTWQMSPDGGKSWRNCTDEDGDGYDTDSFTTMTMTQEMVGYALYFRCQVQGQDNRVTVYTGTTQVIPKRPSPELKMVNATFLQIETDPRTGERMLTGHTVGTKKDAMTPVEIRNAVDMSDVKDGTIEFTNKGRVMKDTDTVVTGTVVTLLDSKGIPLDDVVVIVKGDVMGTGESSLSQLTTLAKARKGTVTLSSPFQHASDHNNNGQYYELSDIVAQAKLYREAGGKPPEPSPDPSASASPSPSASRGR